MAVSAKNKENNLPPVKVLNAEDLSSKLENPQIKSLAKNIPLVNYGVAIKNAYEQAPAIPNINKSRGLATLNEAQIRNTGCYRA